MEAYIGQIILFAGNYEPMGWAICDGRSLEARRYTALYSLIGNSYGGVKDQSFNLPDLRSLVPIGADASSPLGTVGGAASSSATAAGSAVLALTEAHLPAHSHGATFSPAAISVDMSVAIPAVQNPSSGSTSVDPSPASSLCQVSQCAIYTEDSPAGNALAVFSATIPGPGGGVTLQSAGSGSSSVSVTAPVKASTQQPFLAINYLICLICLNGNYPTPD
jgi:Microcystin-dependent protein